jgi:formylglycine-generating enzyme required for sulfatase activity
VSWDDCQEFCKLTGLSLPTEAQWEYACRAGTGTPYYSGNTEEDLKSVGWYSGNSEGKVHAVGSKDPNAFGLYDMHGNVWEWCVDVYDAEFYSKREALEKDPVYTSGSEFRVFRGGSWSYIAVRCRSACRGNWHPSHRNLNLGFRPVRPLPCPAHEGSGANEN